MFEYTTQSGRLTVYEDDNGYYVRDNNTKRTHGCGDGVDWYSDTMMEDYIDTGKVGWLMPGSEELHRAVVADIEKNEDEWLEAYFGEEA